MVFGEELILIYTWPVTFHLHLLILLLLIFLPSSSPLAARIASVSTSRLFSPLNIDQSLFHKIIKRLRYHRSQEGSPEERHNGTKHHQRNRQPPSSPRSNHRQHHPQHDSDQLASVRCAAQVPDGAAGHAPARLCARDTVELGRVDGFSDVPD